MQLRLLLLLVEHLRVMKTAVAEPFHVFIGCTFNTRSHQIRAQLAFDSLADLRDGEDGQVPLSESAARLHLGDELARDPLHRRHPEFLAGKAKLLLFIGGGSGGDGDNRFSFYDIEVKSG